MTSTIEGRSCESHALYAICINFGVLVIPSETFDCEIEAAF